MLVFLRYGVIVLKHVGLPHQRESHQGVLAKHLVVLTAVHSLQGQLHKVAPMPVSNVSAKKSLSVEWRQLKIGMPRHRCCSLSQTHYLCLPIDAYIFAYDGRYRCTLIMFIYGLFERVVGVSTIVYSFCEGYNLKWLRSPQIDSHLQAYEAKISR
jgi:hypothetical protein